MNLFISQEINKIKKKKQKIREMRQTPVDRLKISISKHSVQVNDLLLLLLGIVQHGRWLQMFYLRIYK